MEVATEIVEIKKDNPKYPAVLKEIPDAPDRIFVRGNWDAMLERMQEIEAIGVVGSRKATPYGIATTKQLIGQIASNAIVVSGLAYGIDALAHDVTIKSGGLTIAVLGSGLDDASIYPAKHLTLAREIIKKGGVLVSEYPPGTPPLPYHFPLRNRIIAGLSSKVLVIEAGESSGALITAKLALDYNREVLAIPGPIGSEMSKGPNKLIQDGAIPVLRASDIVNINTNQQAQNLTDDEQKIYKTLMSTPMHLDSIVRETELPVSKVLSSLTMLEIKGVVINTGSGTFSVANTK